MELHEGARRRLGLSPLHTAILSGKTREVIKILDSPDGEVKMNSRDIDGSTPLMTAVLTGRLAIARLLLQKGASIKAKDSRGHLALQYARASLFKRKLKAYRRLGFPAVTKRQKRYRHIIAKILRYPVARASRFVFPPR
jgi:ankyrin repeat protein